MEFCCCTSNNAAVLLQFEGDYSLSNYLGEGGECIHIECMREIVGKGAGGYDIFMKERDADIIWNDENQGDQGQLCTEQLVASSP